jgi:hypothetical protein
MSITAVSNNTNRVAATAAGASDLTPRTPGQKRLKKTVDELVGTVFFGEVFKTVRQSTLKGKYGHGGRGEEVFSAQLHDVLAKRLGQSKSLGINNALYKRFAKLV